MTTWLTRPGNVDLRSVGEERMLREIHRTLLLPNVLPEKLISADDLVHGVRAGTERVLAAATCGGTIVATAVGRWYPRSRVQMLCYLAVRPESRGRDTEARVLRAAIRQWNAELRPSLIVGDLPNPPPSPGGERAEPRRFEGGRCVPDPAILVFAADERARNTAGTIDGGLIERFLLEHLEAVEGCLR